MIPRLFPLPLPRPDARRRACLLAIFGLLPAFSVHGQTWSNAGSGDWFASGNWSGGTVPVTPADAIIDNGGTAVISSGTAEPRRLFVGSFGTGSLQLLDGASLTTGNTLVGDRAAANGTIVVDGAGTQWTSTNTSGVEIGSAGTGSMTISGGAHVTHDFSSIGMLAGSNGTVTVTGSGSQWTHTGFLGISEVGSQGRGTLTISDGGQVTNTGTRIGDEAGSNGAVVVSGTGSKLINSSSLIIGVAGTGSLTIEQGAIASNGYAMLGSTASSSGTAVVRGSGSTWTSSGDLTIGGKAVSALTVSAGGKVANVNGYVGDHSSLAGASTATITGASSQWINSGELYVGSWGHGTLSIADGATVSNTHGIVGFKAGKTGGVTVSGANSKWTNSGSLTLGSSGSGTLTIADGGNVTVGATGTGTLTLAAFTGSSGDLLIGQGAAPGTLSAGTVTSNRSSATITFNHNASSYTFAPKITGLVNLAFTGPGTTTLSAANTFVGTTTLSAGTLVLGNRLALQSSTLTYNGGTLSLGAFSSVTLGALAGTKNLAFGGASLTVGGNNATTTFSGALSGTGNFTKAGTGTFTLSGAATHSGGTVVSAGTLRTGATNVLSANSALFVINGSTVNLDGYNQTVGDLDSYDSAARTFDTGTLQLGGATLTTLTRVTNNWVGGVTGSGNVVKQGAALALWSGANTFTGTLTVAAGTLSAGAVNTLSANAVVAVANGATLDLASFRQTTAGLSGRGAVTLGSATLTLQQAAQTEFSGVISGTGALVKNGVGTLVLSGANTYSGGTTLAAGTLQLGADQALGSGALAINGGTLALAGFDQTLGTLALGGDAIVDFGTGASSLAFANSAALAWTGTLTLFNYTIGSDTLSFGSASGLTLDQLSLINLSGYTITGLDAAGVVQFSAIGSAIPEPSTYAALFGAAALALAFLRKRRTTVA